MDNNNNLSLNNILNEKCPSCGIDTGILVFKINFGEILRLCTNSSCEKSIEICENKSKSVKNSDDLKKLKLDDILNNVENLFNNEISKLDKILFDDLNNKTVVPPTILQSEPAPNPFQCDKILIDGLNNRTVIPAAIPQSEPAPNPFQCDIDEFNDFLNSLDVDTFTFNNYTDPMNTNTLDNSGSFIDTITKTNNLIYNDDSMNDFSQHSDTSTYKSNSSIILTKLSDINPINKTELPVFDKIIILNEKSENKGILNDQNKESVSLANNIDYKSSNGCSLKSTNDENEQDLLPWERTKRTKKLPNSSSNKTDTSNIFKQTIKPSGITKQNLSTKIKEQKQSISNKEKTTAFKTALLEDSSELLSSLTTLKKTKQQTFSYRDIALNILKKKIFS